MWQGGSCSLLQIIAYKHILFHENVRSSSPSLSKIACSHIICLVSRRMLIDRNILARLASVIRKAHTNFWDLVVVCSLFKIRNWYGTLHITANSQMVSSLVIACYIRPPTTNFFCKHRTRGDSVPDLFLHFLASFLYPPWSCSWRSSLISFWIILAIILMIYFFSSEYYRHFLHWNADFSGPSTSDYRFTWSFKKTRPHRSSTKPLSCSVLEFGFLSFFSISCRLE